MESVSAQVLLPAPPGQFNLIMDSQIGKSFGALRVIPLLKRLGYIKFTFAYKWRKMVFPLTPFRYVRARKHLVEDQLVCITSQRIERKSYSIKDLLDGVGSQTINDFTLVVDNKNFVVKEWIRPLTDLRHIQYEYKILARHYQVKFFGENFKPILKDTENILFQEMAWVYRLLAGKEIKSTENFFIFNKDTCFLPSWDILIRLARTEITFNKIKRGLSFWVEKAKTLEKISNRIWDALRDFDYDRKEIIQSRRKLLKKWKPIKIREEKLMILKKLQGIDEWGVLRSEPLI